MKKAEMQYLVTIHLGYSKEMQFMFDEAIRANMFAEMAIASIQNKYDENLHVTIELMPVVPEEEPQEVPEAENKVDVTIKEEQ